MGEVKRWRQSAWLLLCYARLPGAIISARRHRPPRTPSPQHDAAVLLPRNPAIRGSRTRIHILALSQRRANLTEMLYAFIDDVYITSQPERPVHMLRIAQNALSAKAQVRLPGGRRRQRALWSAAMANMRASTRRLHERVIAGWVWEVRSGETGKNTRFQPLRTSTR